MTKYFFMIKNHIFVVSAKLICLAFAHFKSDITFWNPKRHTVMRYDNFGNHYCPLTCINLTFVKWNKFCWYFVAVNRTLIYLSYTKSLPGFRFEIFVWTLRKWFSATFSKSFLRIRFIYSFSVLWTKRNIRAWGNYCIYFWNGQNLFFTLYPCLILYLCWVLIFSIFYHSGFNF